MKINRDGMTPELFEEACLLMAIGYPPRHAAYIVNINVSQLAKAITGQGDEDGISTLEKQVRVERTNRIKRNIYDYPNVSLFSEAVEVAA